MCACVTVYSTVNRKDDTLGIQFRGYYWLRIDARDITGDDKNPLDSFYDSLNAKITTVEKGSEEFALISEYVRIAMGDNRTPSLNRSHHTHCADAVWVQLPQRFLRIKHAKRPVENSFETSKVEFYDRTTVPKGCTCE